MVLHVATARHFHSGGHHKVQLEWVFNPASGNRPLYWSDNKHKQPWQGIMNGDPTAVHPGVPYIDDLMPNHYTGAPGPRGFNRYKRRHLTYDDIINRVTTIYADFVLGSTGENTPDRHSSNNRFSKDLHKHLLGGVNPGNPEVLASNYTFPGIARALKTIFDHKDNTVWALNDAGTYKTTGGDDHYTMPIYWLQDMRNYMLKLNEETGALWVDEANAKMYTDEYETARFDTILENMMSRQVAQIENTRALLSKVENDMVKAGRLEYLYLSLIHISEPTRQY